MKKYIIILSLLICAKEIFAQQDALYSQYMFNPFAINPAYAGSRNALSSVLLFRNQWVGIDGAPSTQTFSTHGPIAKDKMALGLNVFNDAVGPSRNSGIQFTYAYKLKLRKAKLSFALRGGLFNSRFDNNLLFFNTPGDHFDNQGTAQTVVPTFDFGTYYYTNKAYLGLSVNHLLENKIDYNDFPPNAFILMKRHFMLSAGAALPLGENTIFKPSALVRYVIGAPINIDINASFLFKKVFWLGASVRSAKSLVLITEYNITDFIRLGYSYDMTLTRLKQFTTGSHELMLGMDLNFKKTTSISPRYL